MTELTPEKRAELRALIAKSGLADDEAAIAHSLLDAVEERDRMRRLCDAAISTIELKQKTEEECEQRIAALEVENAKLREQLRKVVAEEREACAKIADSHTGWTPDSPPYDRGWSRGAMRIANAIRQRENEATS